MRQRLLQKHVRHLVSSPHEPRHEVPPCVDERSERAQPPRDRAPAAIDALSVERKEGDHGAAQRWWETHLP